MIYITCMATVFDTLAFTRRLTDSGMDRCQSEAIASAVHDAVRGSVATQHDLDVATHKLELRIHGVEAKLLVLQWMVGAIVTGVLALVAKAFF